MLSLKFIVFMMLLILIGCDEVGDSPPSPSKNSPEAINNTPADNIEDTPAIEISLEGESGEIAVIEQQISGQTIEPNAVVNATFANASGTLRTTSTGEGNFTLGLTATDPDGLASVILYVPNLTRNFILCASNCGSSFQVTLTGINPQLMNATPGSVNFELYIGDELSNLVIVDSLNINWQPIQIPSVNATRSDGIITLNWESNPAVLGYNLYAATQQGINASDVLSLDNGIQQLSITANSTQFTDADPSKEYQLLITGINFEGESGSSAILTIPRSQQSTNQSPIAQADQYTIEEDNVLVGNVIENDSDANAQVISLSEVIELPKNGIIEFDDSGDFTYTPEIHFFGDDSFVYKITDSEGASAEANVEINISNVNDNPIISDDSLTLNSDLTLTIEPDQLLANDSDSDGDELAVLTELITLPSFGTVTVNSDGSFSYSANADFIDSDSFVYQVSDGQGGLSEGTIFILLDVSDEFPVAQDDIYRIEEDSTLVIDDVIFGVLANDSDINDRTYQLADSLLELPQNGQLNFSQDGTFTYIPNSDFFGSDQFQYQIINSAGNTAQAFVKIDVLAQVDSPVTIDDKYEVNEDEVLSILVDTGILKNDYDPDLGQIYLNTPPENGPTQGRIDLQDDGSFIYTPNTNFTGVDSFSYQVYNDNDLASTSQVTLSVLSVNDDPVAVDDDYETNADGTVLQASSVLDNDDDIDSDTLTVNTTAVSDVNYGTLTLFADGTFTYEGESLDGEVSFIYSVTDNNGGFSEATVTITPYFLNQ